MPRAAKHRDRHQERSLNRLVSKRFRSRAQTSLTSSISHRVRIRHGHGAGGVTENHTNADILPQAVPAVEGPLVCLASRFRGGRQKKSPPEAGNTTRSQRASYEARSIREASTAKVRRRARNTTGQKGRFASEQLRQPDASVGGLTAVLPSYTVLWSHERRNELAIALYPATTHL
jgi:hypothetical protein